MIIGVKEWDNRKHHYSQENNPTDLQRKKEKIHDWLETCGPTAAVNCIAAMGYPVDIITPGTYRPQPEETLNDWFHDPRNYNVMDAVRPETPPDEWMGNRIPQFYQPAVKSVFGVSASFEWISAARLRNTIMQKKAVQVCLKSPSHYIAILAYDTSTTEFIFNDSWVSRPGLKNRGFNEKITFAKLSKNMQGYGIIYY